MGTAVLRKRRSPGFTLVELLVVIAVIGILAGLTLFAAFGALNQAARKRATAEIQAMSTALESYKTDNGTYPVSNGLTSSGTTPFYPQAPDPNPGGGGLYAASSGVLYTALSGCNGTATTTSNTTVAQTPIAGQKVYLTFKASQLNVYGNAIFIQDPFHYSYGYSTGNPSAATPVNPVNGAGFFDLWSTAGKTGTDVKNDPQTWITNWQ